MRLRSRVLALALLVTVVAVSSALADTSACSFTVLASRSTQAVATPRLTVGG